MKIETYIEVIKALTLSGEEKQMVIDKRKGQCICKQCPNYLECSPEEDELAMCTLGKSECITVEKACICPKCPLYPEIELKNQFYCIRGSEKQQLVIEVLEVRKEWIK
jgi:hypothetical protein